MKKSVNKKARLKKELDRKFQKIFIDKHPYCLVCGKPTSEAHHFIFKSQSLYLRWKMKNLIPLCKSCHYKLHLGDSSIIAIIIRKKGWEWYDDINKDRYRTMKNTLENLRGIEEKLKGRLE